MTGDAVPAGQHHAAVQDHRPLRADHSGLYALIVLGRTPWRRWGNSRMWAAALPVLAVMLVLVSTWTRLVHRRTSPLERREDLTRQAASRPRDHSYWEWNSYHGAYDLTSSSASASHHPDRLPVKWLPDHLWEEISSRRASRTPTPPMDGHPYRAVRALGVPRAAYPGVQARPALDRRSLVEG